MERSGAEEAAASEESSGASSFTENIDVMSTNYVDYLTDFTLDQTQLPNAAPTREDLLRVRTNNRIRYREFLDGRDLQAMFDGRVYLDHYDTRSDLDSQIYSLDSLVTQRLNKVLTLGGGYGFEYRKRDQETQSTSHKFLLDGRYRPDKTWLTRLVLSTSFFDYNDYFGTGLDQTRYEARFFQHYFPYQDRTVLLLGLRALRADADAARNSYNRYIAELRGNYEIDEVHSVQGWLRYNNIAYDGQFNALEPFGREDDRYEAGVGYRYTFSETLAAFVEFNYIDNESNTTVNNYDSTRSTLGVDLRF